MCAPPFPLCPHGRKAAADAPPPRCARGGGGSLLWSSAWPPSAAPRKRWTARAFLHGRAVPRGAGWWPGRADIGWRNRLGWYAGFHVLVAVNPGGVMTGCLAVAGQQPRPPTRRDLLCPAPPAPPEGAKCGRPRPWPVCRREGLCRPGKPCSVGDDLRGAGPRPPKRTSKTPWPKPLRRWRAGVRQIVETGYEKRDHPFRLDRERPHDLRVFGPVWRRRLRGIIFVSGCMDNWAGHGWPSPTWWTGKLMRFHTKRLNFCMPCTARSSSHRSYAAFLTRSRARGTELVGL